MESLVKQLEILQTAASFDPRRKKHPLENEVLIANIFQILGSRSIAADRLIKAIPDSDEYNSCKGIVGYFNEQLKQLLAIP